MAFGLDDLDVLYAEVAVAGMGCVTCDLYIDADGLHGVCNYTGLSAWHLGACAMRLAYDTYLVRVCMELYAIMGLTV